jgi:hypothetical protein
MRRSSVREDSNLAACPEVGLGNSINRAPAALLRDLLTYRDVRRAERYAELESTALDIGTPCHGPALLIL